MTETPTRRGWYAGRALAWRGALLVALIAMVVMALSAAASPGGAYAGYATLRKAPSGSTQLSWNPQSHRLTVRVWLMGLAPNSWHPEHIHSGNCAKTGGILYTLPTLHANAGGVAQMTATIANVKHGIPASGWAINVHNGPGLGTTAQYEPIVCGAIYNPDTFTGDFQFTRTYLGPTNEPNQSVWGSARLWISGSNLYVRLRVGGLAPHSAHAAHIHKGSCYSQGGVVYMLKNVVANASGFADETTVVKGVTSIPFSGWYINVHRTTNLSTQTGFDPITCGNIHPE